MFFLSFPSNVQGLSIAAFSNAGRRALNSSGVYPVIAINSFGLLAVSSKLIIISSSCILACLYKKKTLKYQQNQNTASLKIDIMSILDHCIFL
ncbi:MAG: hypothetical protein D3917_06320 [Candidatus Electrothrix sp. AX5]|nr:hypothetical protein [Candidatus Electrothrix sp. AX5]